MTFSVTEANSVFVVLDWLGYQDPRRPDDRQRPTEQAVIDSLTVLGQHAANRLMVGFDPREIARLHGRVDARLGKFSYVGQANLRYAGAFRRLMGRLIAGGRTEAPRVPPRATDAEAATAAPPLSPDGIPDRRPTSQVFDAAGDPEPELLEVEHRYVLGASDVTLCCRRRLVELPIADRVRPGEGPCSCPGRGGVP